MCRHAYFPHFVLPILAHIPCWHITLRSHQLSHFKVVVLQLGWRLPVINHRQYFCSFTRPCCLCLHPINLPPWVQKAEWKLYYNSWVIKKSHDIFCKSNFVSPHVLAKTQFCLITWIIWELDKYIRCTFYLKSHGTHWRTYSEIHLWVNQLGL